MRTGSVHCWEQPGASSKSWVTSGSQIMKMTVGLLCAKISCSEYALPSYMSPFQSIPRPLPPQPNIQAHCRHLPTARQGSWSWEVTRDGGGRMQECPSEPLDSSLPCGVAGEQVPRPSNPNLSWPCDLGQCTWLLHAISWDAKTINAISSLKAEILNLRFTYKPVLVGWENMTLG